MGTAPSWVTFESKVVFQPQMQMLTFCISMSYNNFEAIEVAPENRYSNY